MSRNAPIALVLARIKLLAQRYTSALPSSHPEAAALHRNLIETYNWLADFVENGGQQHVVEGLQGWPSIYVPDTGFVLPQYVVLAPEMMQYCGTRRAFLPADRYGRIAAVAKLLGAVDVITEEFAYRFISEVKSAGPETLSELEVGYIL